jgi:hypothetical protein
VADILAVIKEMAKNSSSVSLPTDGYVLEKCAGPRTLNRVYPWYNTQLVEKK